MYQAEVIPVPDQRNEITAAKYYAGRNIATRIIDLQRAYDTGDDALIEQAQQAVEAKVLEEIGTTAQ